MEFAEDAQEDRTLLKAIADAEINTLRQQMAQLADDLRRNVAVLSTKEEEATKLRSTVDGLRTLLAEKDHLFAQFQAQVEELEALRIEESAKRAATEQLLAAHQQEWKQQQGVAQEGIDSEITRLQQQLKESEEQWSTQLMQTRQAALDESIQHSTQQQAIIDRAAENKHRFQQQLETLESALAVKELEVDSAHRQLASALDGVQRTEATHAKAIAAKEVLISQLQQQLDQQTASITATNSGHEVNMAKLIGSINQMQESLQGQALEVQEYAAGQKRLQDERKMLKDQLKQQEVAMTKLQTEKGILEAALQHEVTAQASTQAQLNIFQAKLTEAVVDLEKRCAAAEARSSKLMAQLVEERGRLVDAVIEQANSSTPQLAAELAKSLEADRLRTQAELQVAQERSRSLAEELALIRSTLLPLVTTPGAAGPAAHQANGSLAALAQMVQHGTAAAAVTSGFAVAEVTSLPGSPAMTPYSSPGVACDRRQTYTLSPNAAACCSTAATATEYQALAQHQLPARSSRMSSAANSPVTASYVQLPRQYGLADGHMRVSQQCVSSTRTTPQRGSLAGLVCDLQADVDKLQQQLHSSRKQLNWEGQQCSDGKGVDATPRAAGDRPSSSGAYCHSSNSPARRRLQQQDAEQHQEQQQQHVASCSQHSHQQLRPSSVAGTPAVGDLPGNGQLADALKYLFEKTQQLSAENGALKTQLGYSSPDRQALAGALRYVTQHRITEHHDSLRHSGSPHAKNHRLNSSNSRQQHKTVVSSHCKSTPAVAVTDDIGECHPYDDTESLSTEHSSMRDDLSVAASEELAAARAVAAAECSRRRRQADTNAAAAQQPSRSPHKVDTQQYYSPGDSRDNQSDISSCITLASASAGVPANTSDGSVVSSSSRLLETVLASYPHNRLGKLMSELVSTIGSGGAAAAAKAADPIISNRGTGHRRRCAGLGSSCSRGGTVNTTSHAALAREQLRRLADLSPTRQRLLRALARAECVLP